VKPQNTRVTTVHAAIMKTIADHLGTWPHQLGALNDKIRDELVAHGVGQLPSEARDTPAIQYPHDEPREPRQAAAVEPRAHLSQYDERVEVEIDLHDWELEDTQPAMPSVMRDQPRPPPLPRGVKQR
jgi:hypothetical protein